MAADLHVRPISKDPLQFLCGEPYSNPIAAFLFNAEEIPLGYLCITVHQPIQQFQNQQLTATTSPRMWGFLFKSLSAGGYVTASCACGFRYRQVNGDRSKIGRGSDPMCLSETFMGVSYSKHLLTCCCYYYLKLILIPQTYTERHYFKALNIKGILYSGRIGFVALLCTTTSRNRHISGTSTNPPIPLCSAEFKTRLCSRTSPPVLSSPL